MKVSEPDEPSLNLYLWRIECPNYERFKQNKPHDYLPSTNWSQGGPLIDKYKITILSRTYCESNYCEAIIDVEKHRDRIVQQGHDPLIAACRAIIASVYGETIDER